MTVRLLSIPADQYHADDLGETPTLSASIANVLLNQSPAHARAQHPRLNPHYERKTEERFAIGTAAHKLLLEGESVIEVIVADNFRTKAAQEHRDEAIAHGRIPLLAKDADQVIAMVKAIGDQLARFDLPPLADGQVEQTFVWSEDGVACRSRLDWFVPDLILDLKTTSRSARPQAWAKRALFDHGCDLQCVMYRRAVHAVTGTVPRFRWIVVETTEPYALSVIEPDTDVLAYGEARLDKALAVWRECLASGEWPAYGTTPYLAPLPAYLESQWLADEVREELAA